MYNVKKIKVVLSAKKNVDRNKSFEDREKCVVGFLQIFPNRGNNTEMFRDVCVSGAGGAANIFGLV